MRFGRRFFAAAGFLAASALLSCRVSAPARGPSIVIGPYIQNPGPASMTVMYMTDTPAEGVVRYGEGAALDLRAKALLRGTAPGDGAYVYQARVTGLRAGKEYAYRVFPAGDSDAGASSPRHFRTFPEDAPSVTFIAYSDTQTNPSAHREVASNFDRYGPAFILHAGDMTDRGTNFSLLPPFFNVVAGIVDHVPMMIAIGNHDGGQANLLRIFDLPGGRSYYSFDCGPVHIVMLDAFQEGPEALQWLDQDLAAAKAPWKIAAYHTPTFNLAGHHSNDHRQSFLPLFVKHGVDVVFAGHSHVYERFKPMIADASAGRVITFITTGSAGGRLRPVVQHAVLARAASIYDYLVVTADSETFRIEVFESAGKVFDSLTIAKKAGKYDDFYIAQAIPMIQAVKATAAASGSAGRTSKKAA